MTQLENSWFTVSVTPNPGKLRRLLFRNAGSRDKAGWTALMHAASVGNVQNIKLLLEAERDKHSPSNRTALMVAVENGQSQAVVSLLSQTGIRIISNDPKYKPGTTALVIAAECGNVELFNLLLPYEKEAADLTDLHVFAFQHLTGHIKSQQLKIDILGRSPLHYAVMIPDSSESYKQMLRKLCTHPDLKKIPVHDKYGLTPLHYAVIYENGEAVKILCQYFSGYGTSQACKQFKVNTTALMMAT